MVLLLRWGRGLWSWVVGNGEGEVVGLEGAFCWCWLVGELRSLIWGVVVRWWGLMEEERGVGAKGMDGTVEFGVGGGCKVWD